MSKKKTIFAFALLVVLILAGVLIAGKFYKNDLADYCRLIKPDDNAQRAVCFDYWKSLGPTETLQEDFIEFCKEKRPGDLDQEAICIDKFGPCWENPIEGCQGL